MFVPVPAGRRAPPNPAAMTVVFGFMLAAGLVGTHLLGIRPWLLAKGAERWRATPCRILRSGVQARPGSKGKTNYSVGVGYAYEWEGRKRQGTRYDFRPTSSGSFAETRAIVDRIPPGTETTCWVNPEDPSEAVLDRELGEWIAVALLPLLFAGVGVVGLLAAARERAKQHPRPSIPRSAPPPSSPPGPAPIRPR